MKTTHLLGVLHDAHLVFLFGERLGERPPHGSVIVKQQQAERDEGTLPVEVIWQDQE